MHLYLYCGNLGCSSRKESRRHLVSSDYLKDGQVWVCDECKQNDEAAPVLQSSFGTYDHMSIEGLEAH